jgi:hypothetical protein
VNRLRSPLPSFRSIKTPSWLPNRPAFLRRRPSRLTMGVAAATVATGVTAMTLGLSGGGGPGSAAAHSVDVINHASAAPGQAAPQPAASQQPQPQATHQAAAPAQPAQPAQPYLIYDTVSPSSLPAGNAMAAVYATGHFAASQSQVAGRPVVWIDTTGTDNAAEALDVEPGNVTPSQAGTWAYNRLNEYPNSVAILYTFQNEWPQVQAAVAGLPSWMQSHIRWWIADPTGVPHMVPGAQATQWYWGPDYDISTALPNF